jgi:pyruvate/2-oxoglutarate dehydrogenase complex dihydrolipoamide dehydrogenase (E3) component
VTPESIKADIAIIGAGSGGLSIASGAAQLGLKVVLFEKGKMGGDCLNYGCVPSKALIAAAGAAHGARTAQRLGVTVGAVNVDFAAVMKHVRQTIEAIAPVDSQERFEGLGVRVVREAARFIDHQTVASDSVSVTARKIVVATGSTAAVPPIPGLADTPHLTNETIFSLTELPMKLLVLGGGPIGVELGQAFRRLGSEVAIIEADKLLGREDPDLAAIVIEQLRSDGIALHSGSKAMRVEPGPTLIIETDGVESRLSGSHLLVAVGRKPTLDGLDLDRAGVKHDRNGIVTDRSLRSSNKRVHAVGDVAGRGQFTHLAGSHAALVVRRALFAMPINADSLVVPRVTYTDPELAAVGISEADAIKAYGDSVRVVQIPMEENDRAQAEGDTRGFAKLVTSKSGKVLGVTMVGPHAGDHIYVWSLVMSAGIKLSKLTSAIAPYPTRGEVNKRLAGMWYTPSLFSGKTRALVSVLKHFA